MQTIIYFLYTVNCLLLIGSVLMQQPQAQGVSGHGQSLFGSAGTKDVMYRTTQILIAGFFIFAFLITVMDFQQQQIEQQLLFPQKLIADLPGSTEVLPELPTA